MEGFSSNATANLTSLDLGMSPFFNSGQLAWALFSMSLTCLAQAKISPGPFTFSNSKTSLTFLYQNNLNASDDVNHVGAILLDPATLQDGASECASLGESLLPIPTLEEHTQDFEYLLSYLAFAGLVKANQQYYVQDGILAVNSAQDATLGFSASRRESGSTPLPILCTQSSTANGATNAEATASNELIIPSAGNTYVGFRNQKSFRFIGIPYANPFQRWEYSTVFDQTGQVINATAYGPDCVQVGDDNTSEDCLYLNIQTPYIPRVGSTEHLRPVMFTIHGGGFTGGNGGGGSGLDGGNLASREDIVSVQLNYRLSTLGFLAVPGTNIKGNYGIGDQITALQWVKKNIASFGGDPNNVIIIGESAGAGSVRTLLGSPPVIRDNLIAGAVSMSNLGGGKALGIDGDYATTYSSYLTINQSYTTAGPQIFSAVGCNQTTVEDQLACLKTVSADELINLSTVARYVVQDGTIVNTEQLIVSKRNGSSAYVPVIFGTTENDGASFCGFPPDNITSEVLGIASSLGISETQAQRVIDSGLFPFYNSGNLSLDAFNVSQRVSTDLQFRCIDEATVYAASVSGAFPRAYYYNIDRTYEGYDPLNLGPALNGGDDAEGSYFRLHGSDLGFNYGNQYPLRDERDLQASQLISGYYAQFTKDGQPNPSQAYLQARGYVNTLQAIKQTGTWDPVKNKQGPTKRLDYPSPTVDFPDLEQCTFLNYTLSYYLDGGS